MKLGSTIEQLDSFKKHNYKEELEQLKKQLTQEKLLKETAINKLAEIMNRKEMNLSGKAKTKGSSADLRKKEKENRKLQQDLTNERELFNQKVSRAQKEINDLQAILHEETQTKIRLQMELTAKDDELEQLQQKLLDGGSNDNLNPNHHHHGNNNNSALDTISMASTVALNSTTSIGGIPADLTMDPHSQGQDIGLEGWLSVPNKQNIRRHGWRKHYVVVTLRKIIFYNNELKSDPTIILDLR